MIFIDRKQPASGRRITGQQAKVLSIHALPLLSHGNLKVVRDGRITKQRAGRIGCPRSQSSPSRVIDVNAERPLRDTYIEGAGA
jgi:hypothetical protein